MSDLEKELFSQSWNFKNRDNIIKLMQEKSYDVIVIGGGITGAGVAREASMRNLKVALIEMQDFAAGTSSRSTKMAHGGIRYLSLGELDLVKEATQERNWLRAHLPHLVRPVPFYLPYIEGGKYKKRDLKAALKLYDFLSDNKSEFKNFKTHEWYSSEKILELEPEFRREGNLGGAVYYDNNIDDARLTIEILKEAIIRGADILNYCKVIGYVKENGKIVGVKCKDLEKNGDLEIKATLIVNATGIWTDNLIENHPENIPKPLIRSTKGVHLQYRREHIKNRMAAGLYSIKDNRSFFVIPRDKNFSILGTTDTDFNGDLANPFCNKEDADYLIQSVKFFYPNSDFSYENIISTYAGIRPLVMQKGKSESEVSRKHIVFFSNDGLLTITGGKLTGWRAMAEDLFKHVEERRIFTNIEREQHFSRQKFIISIEKNMWSKGLEEYGIDLDEDITDHLYQQYGKGAFKILEIIKDNNSLKERIIEENDFIFAEIVYSLKHELTPHLIDVFCRRTEMSLYIRHEKQLDAAKKVADLMGSEYSWTEEKKKEEIKQYIDYIKKTVSFIT